MRRAAQIALALAAAVATVLVTTACGIPPDLTRLPQGTIAAISIGQVNTPGMSLARSVIVTFSANGGELGRITGPATTAADVHRFGDGLLAVPGDRASILTPDDRTDTGPGGEPAAVGSVASPDAQRALMWNSRTDTRFVVIASNAAPAERTVAGSLRAAGFCGGHPYAWTASGAELSSPAPTGRLYRLDDAEPRSVAVTVPAPPTLSSRLLCGPDGHTLLLMVDRSSGTADATRPTLIRIDPLTGAISTTDIHLPVDAGRIDGRTLAVRNGTLSWFNDARALLTVDLSAPTAVARRSWALPSPDADVFVSGDKALVVTASTYSEYDLATGEVIRDPIRIPWLKNVLTSDLEVTGAADA